MLTFVLIAVLLIVSVFSFLQVRSVRKLLEEKNKLIAEYEDKIDTLEIKVYALEEYKKILENSKHGRKEAP